MALAFVAGIGLCLLTWFGGVVAAVAGVLAQPALALSIAAWRRRVELVSWPAWQRDGLALAGLWAAAIAVLAVLAAWPLSALLASGSLPAVLGLSVVGGIFVLALWRIWPVWQGLERDGGALRDHLQGLDEVDRGAWRGLGVAVAIALLAAMVLMLTWPGLMSGGARWAWVIGFALASPAVHLGLQRVAPAEPILIHLDDEPADERDIEPPPAIGEPLEPALYTAARTGRVERALE
ncbi:MAG: hypothetical protein M3374_06905, partial [Pseudomonadota bacterium]|nr:hypothetical protein [Pseudomonadota bacterium]